MANLYGFLSAAGGVANLGALPLAADFELVRGALTPLLVGKSAATTLQLYKIEPVFSTAVFTLLGSHTVLAGLVVGRGRAIAVGSELWVAGDVSAVYRWDGAAFSTETPGNTPKKLGTDDTEVFAAGAVPLTIRKRDSGAWNALSVPSLAPLTNVEPLSPGYAYNDRAIFVVEGLDPGPDLLELRITEVNGSTVTHFNPAISHPNGTSATVLGGVVFNGFLYLLINLNSQIRLYKWNGTTLALEFDFTASLPAAGSPINLGLYGDSLYVVTTEGGTTTRVLKSNGVTTTSWSTIVTNATGAFGGNSSMVPA